MMIEQKHTYTSNYNSCRRESGKVLMVDPTSPQSLGDSAEAPSTHISLTISLLENFSSLLDITTLEHVYR